MARFSDSWLAMVSFFPATGRACELYTSPVVGPASAGCRTRHHKASLLREPEDAPLTEAHQASEQVGRAVFRAECRHHLLLQRRVRDLLGADFVLAGRTLELQSSLALD